MSLGTAKMTAKESHAIIDAARAAVAAGDEVQRV
jgi:hypothetical protein